MGVAEVPDFLAELTRDVMGTMLPLAGPDTLLSAILCDGVVTALPMTRAGVVSLFTPVQAVPAALAWTEMRVRQRFGEYLGGWSELRSYSDWVRYHFGVPVAQRLHLPYCTKRWGAPDEIGSALARFHHGVVDEGAMLAPKAGPAGAIAAQLDRLKAEPHRVLVGGTIEGLRVEDGRIVAVATSQGEVDVPGLLFSALPPDQMLTLLAGSLPRSIVGEAEHLRCRHGLQILLPVDSAPDAFVTHLIDPGVSAWRMIRPEQLPGCESLAGTVLLHLTVDESDPFWTLPNTELRERLAAQLEATGVVKVAPGAVRVNRLPHHEPVWSTRFHPSWNRVMLAMNGLGLRLVGRSGAFGQFGLHGEMHLLEGLLDEQSIDQHEVQRLFVDPPVVNDEKLSLRRFIASY
jgi:hypothetical protein